MEKRAALLIRQFLKSGKIAGHDFVVEEAAQEDLIQALALILQQANAIGKQHGLAMIEHQERAVVSVGNSGGFWQRAKDIVSGIVGRVRDVVAGIFGEGGFVDDAEEAVDNLLDYLPESVADTEVHDEVEQAVMDVFAENDLDYVEWICEPDACEICLGNQDAGPVKRGEAFPSGHTQPGAHFKCRCNLVPVNS